MLKPKMKFKDGSFDLLMYKLVKIKEYAATRDLWLENMQSGTVEKCFDDSKLVCEKDFSFMEIGKEYDCKICLFGAAAGPEEGGTKYKVLSRAEKIGRRERIKVCDGEDVYYIPSKELEGIPFGDYVWFETTRKDLIQVDDVIHEDYL